MLVSKKSYLFREGNHLLSMRVIPEELHAVMHVIENAGRRDELNALCVFVCEWPRSNRRKK